MRNDIVNDRSRTEWESLINEWVHDELDRAMLKRRLLDGICYEPLAEEFYLSVIQVKRRIKKSQEQLFKHIN